MPDTLVFIPAWNEAASLPEVLGEAQRHLPGADLLVIDDGSSDDTAIPFAVLTGIAVAAALLRSWQIRTGYLNRT